MGVEQHGARQTRAVLLLVAREAVLAFQHSHRHDGAAGLRGSASSTTSTVGRESTTGRLMLPEGRVGKRDHIRTPKGTSGSQNGQEVSIVAPTGVGLPLNGKAELGPEGVSTAPQSPKLPLAEGS